MTRVDIKKILRNPEYRKELIDRGVKAMRELANEPPHEVGGDRAKIDKAISLLSPNQIKSHDESLGQGYEDEVCPRCHQVMLAHKHLINCDYARRGECPMVPKGAKSLLQQAMGEKAQDELGFEGCSECGGPIEEGGQTHAAHCSKSKKSLAFAKTGK